VEGTEGAFGRERVGGLGSMDMHCGCMDHQAFVESLMWF
jgi:hypothetical protein